MSESALHRLPHKDRTPNATRHLQRWVEDAGKIVGSPTGDRIGWLVASTVVVAALQRAVDPAGQALFLLKGGVYLEHRFGGLARATKDVDALFRGHVEAFADDLDRALSQPWGPLTLARGDIADLLLIRDHLYPHPQDWGEVREACEDVFAARAQEAEALGLEPRTWPPTVAANAVWAAGWPRVATATGSALSLDAAVDQVNAWITACAAPG